MLPVKSVDRTVLRFIFAALALWLAFVAWAQHDLSSGAVPPPTAERPILILHDAVNEAEARFVAQIAGRFGRPLLRRIEDYSAGDLRRHSAAFVMPASASPGVPAPLIEDLRRTGRPTVWIGAGVEQLLGEAEQGWGVAPYRSVHFASVHYGGLQFAPSGVPAPLILLAPASGMRVLASATTNEGFEAPWALRLGNLTYFAEAPWRPGDSSDRHLVFADLLFDTFRTGAGERRRALVRIEGLGAQASARRLRSLADLLSAERVPFELPVGAELEGIQRQPSLAAALRYATARGGVLVARASVAPPGDRMPPAPFETVDGDGALVIPHNLRSASDARRHQVVRDSLLSYSHDLEADPEALQRTISELRRLGHAFVSPRDAVRAAPAHAELPVRRASPIAVAAAGWLAELPWIDLPVLVALLALATAMWLGGEMLLAKLDIREERDKHGLRKVKPRPRKAQVRWLPIRFRALPAGGVTS